jgi:tetratricopeptide (TPR) repeat protein
LSGNRAIDSLQKILKTQNENSKRVETYIQLAQLYNSYSEYPEALDNYLAALRIFDAQKDSMGIAICNQQIGGIYYELQNYRASVSHNTSAINLFLKQNNQNGLSACYTNISSTYFAMGNLDSALNYNLKASQLTEETGNIPGFAICLTVRGDIYSLQKNYPLALAQYQKAAEEMKKTDDEKGIGIAYAHLASVYSKMNNQDKAISLYKKAIEFWKQPDKEVYQDLGELYANKGDYKSAYECMEHYNQIKDSVFGNERLAKIAEIQNKYETEKSEKITRLENEKKQADIQAKVDKQKIIIWSGSILLFVVLTLAFVIFRAYKQKQNANKIIAQKNKDILDSIRYAKRIQESLLPTDKYIDKTINRMRNQS